MRSRTLTLRALALLGAGSAAIHQLRYAIAYGTGAPNALAAHPHGYLGVAMPGVVTALVIAIAAVGMRAAGAARRTTPSTRARGFAALWLACALALASIYVLQETLEGAGALAGSGWIGIAFALPMGFVVALALRGADAAESLRCPFAALRASVLLLTPLAFDDRDSRGRTGSTRIGARGPPLGFVV